MNDLNSLVEEAVKSAPSAAIATKSNQSGSDTGMNKSQRVREYLKKNPEARNKDVSDALADFGVTPADVGNAKSQMKKKAAKKRATSVSKPAKAGTPASGPAKPAGSSVSAKEISIDAKIGLDVLDAGIEFVNRAGGLNEAQYALNVIRRIKSL